MTIPKLLPFQNRKKHIDVFGSNNKAGAGDGKFLEQTQCTLLISHPEIKGSVLWACINLGTIFYKGGSAG